MNVVNIYVYARNPSTGQDVKVSAKVPATHVLRYYTDPAGVVQVVAANNNATPFTFEAIDSVAEIDAAIAAL